MAYAHNVHASVDDNNDPLSISTASTGMDTVEYVASVTPVAYTTYEADASVATFTVADNTDITVTGNGNTITIGSNDNITLSADPNNPSLGVNDTINAASGADLTTDTLIFGGASIAGSFNSGDTDQYGRTYSVSGTTLTISTAASGNTPASTLTINNFANGDFGLTLGYTFSTINFPSNYLSPSTASINDSGVVVGNEVISGNSAGFIDNNGTFTTLIGPYTTNDTYVTSISSNGLITLNQTANSTNYGIVDNNGSFTTITNLGGPQVIAVNGVNSSGEVVAANDNRPTRGLLLRRAA